MTEKCMAGPRHAEQERPRTCKWMALYSNARHAPAHFSSSWMETTARKFLASSRRSNADNNLRGGLPRKILNPASETTFGEESDLGETPQRKALTGLAEVSNQFRAARTDQPAAQRRPTRGIRAVDGCQMSPARRAAHFNTYKFGIRRTSQFLTGGPSLRVESEV